MFQCDESQTIEELLRAMVAVGLMEQAAKRGTIKGEKWGSMLRDLEEDLWAQLSKFCGTGLKELSWWDAAEIIAGATLLFKKLKILDEVCPEPRYNSLRRDLMCFSSTATTGVKPHVNNRWGKEFRKIGRLFEDLSAWASITLAGKLLKGLEGYEFPYPDFSPQKSEWEATAAYYFRESVFRLSQNTFWTRVPREIFLDESRDAPISGDTKIAFNKLFHGQALSEREFWRVCRQELGFI